jgi:hypothetical protein
LNAQVVVSGLSNFELQPDPAPPLYWLDRQEFNIDE